MSGLRFASIGSGSRGNAMVIEAGDTRVLLDNGFSVRETLRRLERIGVEPSTIGAILVTHEHSDHAKGVASFAARFDIPVFLTGGTLRAMESRGHFDGLTVDCRRVVRGQSFCLGDIDVRVVRVPHDALEPCQYVFEATGRRLGVLTDTGSLTPQIVEAYAACDALFLEFNHDAGMLAGGPYPPSLKTRVGGDFGHLSNSQAASLLALVDRSRLRTLAIGHLSEQNNLPDIARRAAAQATGWPEDEIVAASQALGHGWLPVNTVESRLAGHSGA